MIPPGPAATRRVPLGPLELGDGRLPEHYAIEGMPSSVLIAPDGRVLHRHSGFRTADTETYEAAIRAALPLQEARR